MTSSAYRGTGFVVIGLSLLGLTGCSFQKPTPDQILARTGQSMSALTSFHYNLNLKLNGRIPMAIAQDVSSATIQLTGDLNSKDTDSPEFTVQANITGVSSQGELRLKGELVNLADYTYFKLSDLAMPSLAPMTVGADSRWYKIRHLSPVDPTAKKLGVVEPYSFSQAQLEQIKTLLTQASIAEVTEVLPDATVNNQRSYHYKIKLKPEVMTDLIKQLNSILELKLSSDSPAKLASYQPEIWINKRTFNLSQLILSDLYLVDKVPLAFDLNLGLSRHNEKVKIGVPKDSEELDAQHLLNQKLPF